MSKEINILCNTETGICEVPAKEIDTVQTTEAKPVRLLYFTDPICSSCWGIEPQLRKLQMEYGDYFTIEYKMGGLLQSWDTYGGRDVNGPTSVAQHWDEASAHYGMPIDGDLWIEDPLHSSYPPSIAFKAAQLQGEEKAEAFLRKLREMVFVQKKNITRWEHLLQAADSTGLNLQKFREDYEGGAKDLFEEDLALKQQLGVRGFPTLFFMDGEGSQLKIVGSKPYEKYEQALLHLVPDAEKKQLPTSYETVLNEFSTLTLKEFAVLNNKSLEESGVIIDYLLEQQVIEKMESKNGSLYIKKD